MITKILNAPSMFSQYLGAIMTVSPKILINDLDPITVLNYDQPCKVVHVSRV